MSTDLSASVSITPFADLARVVNALAHRVKHMDSGSLAELRRLIRNEGEGRWRSATFYRLHAELISEGGNETREQRWALLLAGMAALPHQPGQFLGAVLAQAGFAERRFVRLLDADAEHIASELRGMVSFLASRGLAIDWADAARLVHSIDADDGGHAVRRSIASAYYAKLNATT